MARRQSTGWDGQLSPDANVTGSDSFEYTISDNDGLTSDAATVSVSINTINDPPVVVNDDVTTEEDTSITFSPLANDSDVDGSVDVSSRHYQEPCEWYCGQQR